LTIQAITQPTKRPNLDTSLTSQLQTSNSLELISIILSLSVNNYVKVYEISTPKYLHIVLSIYFSVYNLTMAN